MVETRMKTVNALIGNSCSWREDITIIKDVLLYQRRARDERLEPRSEGVIAILKEAGIDITVW